MSENFWDKLSDGQRKIVTVLGVLALVAVVVLVVINNNETTNAPRPPAAGPAEQSEAPSSEYAPPTTTTKFTPGPEQVQPPDPMWGHNRKQEHQITSKVTALASKWAKAKFSRVAGDKPDSYVDRAAKYQTPDLTAADRKEVNTPANRSLWKKIVQQKCTVKVVTPSAYPPDNYRADAPGPYVPSLSDQYLVVMFNTSAMCSYTPSGTPPVISSAYETRLVHFTPKTAGEPDGPWVVTEALSKWKTSAEDQGSSTGGN